MLKANSINTKNKSSKKKVLLFKVKLLSNVSKNNKLFITALINKFSAALLFFIKLLSNLYYIA